MEHTLSGPWYRERWPWLLMAGPAIVVVAGIVTAWIAFSGADGLVAEDWYKQGLALNRVLALEAEGARRGIAARGETSGGRLVLRLEGAHGAPPALFAHFAHATRAGHDVRLRLAAQGEGTWAGELPAPVPGRWRVILEDPQRSWRVTGAWSGRGPLVLGGGSR